MVQNLDSSAHTVPAFPTSRHVDSGQLSGVKMKRQLAPDSRVRLLRMEDWKTRITQIRPVEKPASDPEQACLVLIYPAGAELGKRYELAGSKEVTIGRGGDCDIQVDRDSVSRRHAKVSRSGSGWVVQDLGSTNGSYVNDAQITQYGLRDGD